MIRNGSPLGVDDEEFESALVAAARYVAREFHTPTERPILPDIPQSLFDTLISTNAPTIGCSIDVLRQRSQALLSTHTARLYPPGFSAMISTSPNAFAVLAEVLGQAVGQHVFRGDIAEFASRMEARMARWVADFMGYPARSGIFTSGGSTALLVALAAARVARFGAAVRARGLGYARAYAYTSDQAHFSVDRAIDLLGIGTENLRKLTADEQFRLRPDELEEKIIEDRRAGGAPWVVVAQAGSVSTGAVDPIDALADICQRHGLWLHVDACYGGPAARVEPVAHLFKGLERADSISVDPHKWLYTTYESGCVLTRTENALEQAFAPEGASYVDADFATDAPDFKNRGLDLSRDFRALKVWATFEGEGTDKLKLAISQDIALARLLGQLVTGHAQFELSAPTSLSITVFRFVPEPNLTTAYLDALNLRVPAALRRDGRIYLGSMRLAGKTVLRSCIVNHRVVDHDIENWLKIITEAGCALHARRSDWWSPTHAERQCGP